MSDACYICGAKPLNEPSPNGSFETCEGCKEYVCGDCSFAGGTIEAASSATFCKICCYEHVDELREAADNVVLGYKEALAKKNANV